VPTQWTVEQVLQRLEEAYRTLRKLPMATRPRTHGNSMPAYGYEYSDLVQESQTNELKRGMRLRLRPRLTATADEIERMEEALAWPMQYLADKPEVAQAVGLGALWRVSGVALEERCRAYGWSRRTFLRRKVHGLKLIIIELIRRNVLVT
jgi:hypothetical protein